MIKHSTCPVCGVGCHVNAHISNGRIIEIGPDPESLMNRKLCERGASALEYHHHSGRLNHPLKRAGAKKIYAAITHGILSGDAVDKLDNSVIDSLIITDSISIEGKKNSGKLKVVSVDHLLAEAIKRIHFEKSISVLFDAIGR